ncbi:hypothetical protein PSTG_04836 [Puccinia striiformis f. sp. tritici PST-78]|uniref:Uncharacterized protein n=1 Tax=Puccinia striiformis f. sp. tritici PST-78 TaxID=1165861 RepID=A0A0L0VSQ3_9BASI|nr:hypothetical protein PSTG_04836 [Puccinia striiformis f. sp. tritici PST-78]
MKISSLEWHFANRPLGAHGWPAGSPWSARMARLQHAHWARVGRPDCPSAGLGSTFPKSTRRARPDSVTVWPFDGWTNLRQSVRATRAAVFAQISPPVQAALRQLLQKRPFQTPSVRMCGQGLHRSCDMAESPPGDTL